MTSTFKIFNLLILIVVGSIDPAIGADLLPQTRLPLHRITPIKSSSAIRVKVFPHPRPYPPQGMDRDKTTFATQSKSNCKLYPGTHGRVGRESKMLATKKNFSFSTAGLKNPLWLQCREPVTVIRGANEAQFSYSGILYIHKVIKPGGAELEVINQVSLKDYLLGVVPSEVYPKWPEEALKTQAVAARTYAVFHLGQVRAKKKARLWDVDDTIAFQAYTGVTLRSKRTDAAVMSTLGQILTHDADVIQAYYHADSGGQTEDAINVWNQDIPYVQGRKETFATEQGSSYWQKEISKKELARGLRRMGYLQADEKIEKIAVPVAGRTDSGRVRVVSLRLGGDQHRNITVEVFKRASIRLPSTLFAFKRNPPDSDADKILIEGYGFGHGVGMSQQGAALLAEEKGWNYTQILRYYYSDTDICSLQSKKSEQSLPNCYAVAKLHRQAVDAGKASASKD